ncbi:hypothetical protein I4U23_025333 [Adineta vaga]|nr:hypothetical protein I4U23_025333 [Adineta vaga]
MTESNNKSIDQTHRIFISSPKQSTDRTNLYIFSLLLSLSLILVSYLVYNFISYRRYTRSQKKKHELEKQLNDHLLIVLNQSIEPTLIRQSRANNELTHPLHILTTSFTEHRNSKEIKQSISNQYHISNRLVSDL